MCLNTAWQNQLQNYGEKRTWEWICSGATTYIQVSQYENRIQAWTFNNQNEYNITVRFVSDR